MRNMFRMMMALIAMFMMTAFSMTCEAAQKIVAVMPMSQIVNNGYSSYTAQNMTEELINTLVNSGTYTVIERSQIDKVITEMGFEESGYVNADSAIEIGRLSGAQYILVGKITMADVYNSSVPLIGVKTLKAKVGIEYRLLDGKTGQILLSNTIEDQHTEDELTGSDFSAQVVLHKACSDAAKKVLKEIQKKNPIIGTVLDIDPATNIVYVDLGRGSGLQVGEELQVFKEGTPIYGTNGEIITTRTIELGKIKITEVNDNHSIGKLTAKGAAIERGALVKRVLK